MSASPPAPAPVPEPAAAAAVAVATPAAAAPAAAAPAASAAAAAGDAAASASSSPPPAASPSLVMVPMPLAAVPIDRVREHGFVLDKVDKPFVYGSAAFWRGKNLAESEHSHKWTVYLRGLENEDLSYFIQSVAFTLHESFEVPTRVLYSAPYEVTETGWGEFSIGITITFHEASGLEPVQLQHMLKLFPDPSQGAPSTKKPVMSEVYDEFVFVNPSVDWWDRLHSGPTHKVQHHPLSPYFLTPEFAKDEDQAIAKLQAANETIQMQIDQQRAKLFIVEQEISNLTQKL